MPNLADLRSQFPELADLDDDQAVDALRDAYYPDLPREQVAGALGVKLAPLPAPAAEPSGWMRRGADLGVSALRGAVGVPEAVVGMADLVTGGRAGQIAERAGFRPAEAKQILADYYSPEAKAAFQSVQQAEGVTGKIGAALANPSVIANSVAESVPLMGAGGVVARGLGMAAPSMGAITRGAIGEGAVGAGLGAEQIRQETPDGLLTGKQSLVAAGSGALTGALTVLGGRVAQSLGIKDVDTMLAGAAASPEIRKGVVRRAVEGFAAEGLLEELPQSIQEQVAQNYALGRPLDDGVDQVAVLGLLSGGLIGAGTQMLPSAPAKLPDTGPLSRSVNAGVDSGATTVDSPPAKDVPLLGYEPNTGVLRVDAAGNARPETKDEVKSEQAANAERVAMGYSPRRAPRMQDVTDVEPKAPPPPPAPAAPRPSAAIDPATGEIRADPVAQREADRPPEPTDTAQPGDVLNNLGKPFLSMRGARNALAARGNGYEIKRVKGGLVVRPIQQEATDGRMAVPDGAGPGGSGAAGAADAPGGMAAAGRPDAQPEGALPAGVPADAAPAAADGARPRADAPRLTTREQPTALGTKIDARPKNAPGFTAADVLPRNARNEAETSTAPEAIQVSVQKLEQGAPNAAAPAPAEGMSESRGDTKPPVAAAPAGVTGEPIDQEWTAFAPESKSLGIPRARMPQIKAEHRGAMTQFLKARGIDHEQESEVDPASLKPTQQEFSQAKVQKAREYEGGDRAILVSKDGRVLDGHHQWLAAMTDGKPIRVIRLKAPIRQLLKAVTQFPSAETADGATPANDPNPQARPEPQAQAPADQAPAAARGDAAGAADLPAAGGAAAAQAAGVGDLREQLRKVEQEIINAAPRSLSAGGGDIEAAARHRNVPAELKARRKALKEQIRSGAAPQPPASTKQSAPEIPVSETEQGKPEAVATHKDPGEPAEPVTPAVVRKAIKTGVQATDRKPSAMKAELLAEIDRALLDAPDYNDFDAVTKSMGLKDATAAFTDANGTLGAKSAPSGYSRPTRTFKIEGDGVFTVNNTVRQLLKFRAEVEKSPGFRDRIQSGIAPERASDALDRRSTDAAIANMLDEGDFQAAVDFAESKGVSLDDVKLTKVLRERLEKWQKDQASAKRMAEYEAAQAEGKPAPGSLSAMLAEKDAADAPPDAEPADDIPEAGIASQTFDQWVRAQYNGNEYKAKYLDKFGGDEKRAILGAAVGTIDNDRTTADLLKAAKQEYRSELFKLPRESSISLDVWAALDNIAKVEAQRHFYDLDARITRRDQDATKARVEAERIKKAPYEAAFSEVDAEIRRLDKIDGPVTQKQKDLSARRDRLREAIFRIGQGKEPDGRLLRKEAAPDATALAQPLASSATTDAQQQAPSDEATAAGQEPAQQRDRTDDASNVAMFSRTPDFAASVDAVLDGRMPESAAVPVAREVPVLEALGLPPLPVATTGDRLAKMHFDHGLTRDDLKAMPELLASPVMVFESATQPGSKVLVLDLWRNGKPVVAAVRPNERLKRLDVNLLVSAYPKDRAEQLGAWAKDGKLLYLDKKKSRAWATNGGVQFPWLVQLQRGTSQRILGPADVVKAPPLSRPDFAPTQFGSRRPMVQAVVDAIQAGWKNAPPVQVVRDMNDERIPAAVRDADQAQRSQGASGSPAGFFYDGKVYLVADQIASEAEARRVFWHESLGHFGLRGVFGADLAGILDQIIKARPADLRAKMRQYGLSDTLAGRRYAAEELLAEMAQERPEIGFVKRAIAAIRAWLKRQGFNLGLSDNDIIANFILPARDYVERGAAQMQGNPVPVFTRSAINQYAADRAQGRNRGSNTWLLNGWKVSPGASVAANDTTLATQPAADSSDDGMGAGDGGSVPPMFSRSPAAALNAGLDHPHDIIRRMAPDGIRQAMIDAATSQRGFNRWWHRTAGTQLHKAKINKHFARVYDAVQAYLRDVSGVAHIASDKAATLLPRNDSMGKVFTRPPKTADLKAASEAVFDGTLKDEKVYSDAELREKGLTDVQIGYYREFRAAVDQSLDNLVASDTIRLLTTQSPELLGRNATDSGAAMVRLKELAASENPGMVREEVNRLIGQRLADLDAALSGQPNQHTPDLQTKRERAAQVLDDINDKFDRIQQLKDEGYAPLTRFGPYTLDVLNNEGERVFFGRYESQKAANEDARRFLADGLQVRQGMLSQEEFKLLKGLTPETAMLFAEMAGIERSEAMDAFLKEATAQHSALRRHLKRKGIAGYSPDMQRVLAAFITSNARATSSNLHALETNEALESIPQSAGDVKDEAVKLVRYVQEPAEEAQAIRSLMFMNYIGGSVASALVNMTQTLVQTYPYLSQFGGARKAMGRVSRAMGEALAGAKLDDDLASALARAEKDGIVKPQELFELQAEASRNFGSNPWVRKGVAAWGSFFQIAEQYNRRVAFIAAYRTAKEEGMADPFAFAESSVEETQGVFNKGNRPDWARGAVGATLFTFKGFTIQYIEFLKRLPPKERAIALGVLFLLAGAQGIPFADDADDIIDTVAQALGYNFVGKVERQRFLENAVGKDWAEFLQRGVSGIAGVPFDVSQRLGLGNLLPGTAVLKKSEPRREDQVLEVLGVAGSYARDALRGEFRPIAVRNAAAAIDMYQTGAYRDRDGRRVTGVDATDAALKAIGLQPATVAEDSRITGRNYEQRALYRNVYEDIHKGMARAMFENDDEAKRDIRERLKDWNRKNPEAKIGLSIPSLRRRVQQMKMDRSERFAKSTPKAIRPLLEGQE